MDFQNAAIKLNRKKEEYLNFSKAAGIRPKLERTQVYGFSRSPAARAARGKWTKQADAALAKNDIIIGRSVGAAAKNYRVKLPDGKNGIITEGTKITNIRVFAGYNTDVELRVRYYLAQNYGGDPDKWQKVSAKAFIDGVGKASHIKNQLAEIHWLEEPVARIVEEMKVVKWILGQR